MVDVKSFSISSALHVTVETHISWRDHSDFQRRNKNYKCFLKSLDQSSTKDLTGRSVQWAIQF